MESDREQIKQWVERWKIAGAEIEKIRIEKVRRSKTSEAMLALSDAFDAALIDYTAPKTSGLVEQQKWFSLLRENDSINQNG